MSDMIEVPKITVTLRTDHVDPAAPPLRFMRWKLVPLDTALAVEPEASEPPRSVEGTS